LASIPVIIELLKFRVAPEQREDFIQKDAAVWTAALKTYSGFISKEVWLNPLDNTEVTLIIRWATRQQWQAIPSADLAIIEQKFTQAMGKFYPIAEAAEYELGTVNYPY
jgi:uncharacterized protein (TIGR03792 family)